LWPKSLKTSKLPSTTRENPKGGRNPAGKKALCLAVDFFSGLRNRGRPQCKGKESVRATGTGWRSQKNGKRES